MVMQADGTAYNVDWYFVPVGTPPLVQPNCGSNNWHQPDYPTGPVRELVGAPRPWRDGSPPDYLAFDVGLHQPKPPAGLFAWWVSGAPGPGTGGLRWDGGRGFTNVDGPGIFPPLGPAVPTVVSATRGALTYVGGFPTGPLGWIYQNHAPFIDIVYYFLPKLGAICRPTLRTLCVAVNPFVAGSINPLKCTSYNAGTGVSKWVDAGGFGLDLGDVLTVTAP